MRGGLSGAAPLVPAAHRWALLPIGGPSCSNHCYPWTAKPSTCPMICTGHSRHLLGVRQQALSPPLLTTEPLFLGGLSLGAQSTPKLITHTV